MFAFLENVYCSSFFYIYLYQVCFREITICFIIKSFNLRLIDYCFMIYIKWKVYTFISSHEFSILLAWGNHKLKVSNQWNGLIVI